VAQSIRPHVEVLKDDIVVTLPGTTYKMMPRCGVADQRRILDTLRFELICNGTRR
jgi:hypothetical protein